jgi:hypothetical protein
MLDQTDQTKQHDGKALRDEAEYASLTRRAATDNGRALVDDVLRVISEAETRKRQRVSTADAFRQAVEGFLGDLLAATGEGWIYRPVGRGSFTNGAITYRNFTAAREGLKKLGLSEEIPWAAEFGRTATRFRATPQLQRLAAQYGILRREADSHFVLPLPIHPLRLKRCSRWKGPDKIIGTPMEIVYTDKVTALERTIIDLNDFIDGFDIRGGRHRGYIRQFECGDHLLFNWNLGGRLYSVGADNYQQIGGAERLKMAINDRPVCELDVRASALAIFQAIHGQPLDFSNNLDPYRFQELSTAPRELVKTFINATFGGGQFPARWPRDVAEEYKLKTGHSLGKRHPISQVRDAVAEAYPALAALRRDDAQTPVWARLQFVESEAVLRSMLALQAEGVPSLSVHDSLVVPLDSEQPARHALSQAYNAIAGARPYIVTRYQDRSLT